MQRRCEYCRTYRTFDWRKLEEKIIISGKFFCDYRCFKERMLEKLI